VFDYLTKRFNSHRDAELLLSPADELTRTFVDNVKRAARDRPISLFFGGYEHAAPLLDRWLLRLYDRQHGYLPQTLITTISGLYPLDPKSWRRHRAITADMHLDPFSDTEASRLPVGDPRERYLKSERDPDRRNLAATGALARTFNQDTLAVVTSADNVAELFGWLIGLPFVSQQPASWKYYDGVRSDMIRFQRAQSPSDWRTNHLTLARAHVQWAVEAAGSPYPAWADQDWVDHTVERTYHLLCADPVGNRPQALTSAVMAQASKTVHARQWAELFADAGRELNPDLASAIAGHAVIYMETTRCHDALAAFNRAIELDPDLALALVFRGRSYWGTEPL
jgi:hypothetical protein